MDKRLMLLPLHKEREVRQTSSRADGTVSNIALFHHGAEFCSVAGPNLEPLQEVQVCVLVSRTTNCMS